VPQPALPSPTASSSSPKRWRVLVVATLQQAGLTFVRFGLPTVAPFLRSDLHLSLAQTGVVLGAFDLGALAAFYATGLATERWGEGRVMASGALVTALFTALAALSPSVGLVTLALALGGLGFPSSQVAGSQAVMGWFPPRERGVAMGVRQAGLPVGGLVAAWLLPWLAASWGWRIALVVASVGCGLAGAVTYWALGPTPSLRGRVLRPTGSVRRSPVGFLRSPPLMLTTMTACLLAAGQYALTGYLPLYFVDTFRWRAQDAARLLLFVHLGGIAGRMVWGWVSDRHFGGDRPRPMALAACCAAATVLALALLSRWPRVPVGLAVLLALLAGFTLLGWNGLYVTLISELAWGAGAVAVGLSMTVLYVFTMMAPPAFGWAVERAGSSYTAAWLGVVVLQLCAAATILFVPRVRRAPAGAFQPGD